MMNIGKLVLYKISVFKTFEVKKTLATLKYLN